MTSTSEKEKPRQKSAQEAFLSLTIDRAARHRRDPVWTARQMAADDTRFYPVWGSRVLVTEQSPPRPAWLSPEDMQPHLDEAESVVLLGESGARAHFAVGFTYDGGPPPAGLTSHGRFRQLREVTPLVEAESAALLAYAKAIVHYHHQYRFCARCGAPTVSAEAGHLRVCTDETCAQQDFPRTDPAIIVLVSSGDRCLLGRQASWAHQAYSVIAGFVEPGETLEGAVAREVREETGVLVTDIEYESSQPWPFPRSLMVGFTATATNTEICLGDGELEDARWFSREDIVRGVAAGSLRLSSSISISYRLIKNWFNAGSHGTLKDVLWP